VLTLDTPVLVRLLPNFLCVVMLVTLSSLLRPVLSTSLSLILFIGKDQGPQDSLI